ncbi:hypothetical protein BGW38_010733 [Lunasporangiospora selenospora]|uniref:Ankyrin repeat-containing protein n=1 Tax=Lunasporangiospora selenospora TaxID=979761 RepID=A0A9P6KFB6_9FUNG|nr:hypothetical protein BGW38_010733 [Lunasporangiospora selenospora]
MDGALSDFGGSELSDLSSVSSVSDSDHEMDKDDQDDKTKMSGGTDSDADSEDSHHHRQDSSSTDDGQIRARNKKPRKPIRKGKSRPKNNRRRIQSDTSDSECDREKEKEKGKEKEKEKEKKTDREQEKTKEQERPQERDTITVKRRPGRPPKLKKEPRKPLLSVSPASPTSPRFNGPSPKISNNDDSTRMEIDEVQSPTNCDAPPLKKKIKQPDFLIEAGAQVNDRDNADWTPLHEACVTGHEKVAGLLIQHHADVNAPGGHMDTPLHDAAQNGHAEVVKLLITHGANVLAKNTKGIIPIDVADDKEVINLLQRRQALITMLTGRNQAGQTLLHRACTSGSLDNATDLVSQGADINARDNAHWTPLHEAALAGHTEIVELLLSKGADPNAFGHENDTALHDATENEHEDVVRLLLEYGANPDLRNSKGEKPCDVSEHEGILSLLENGARGTKKAVPNTTICIIASNTKSAPQTQRGSTLGKGASATNSKRYSRKSYKEDSVDANMSDDGRSASEDKPTHAHLSRDERKMQQLLSTIRMQEQMEEKRRAKKRSKQAFVKEEENDPDMRPALSSSNDTQHGHAKRPMSETLSNATSAKNGGRSGKGTRHRSTRSEDRSGTDSDMERSSLTTRRTIQRSLSDRFRIDPRSKDSEGRTQLHHWAENGDIEMVGTMLEGGVESSPVDHAGRTPLHLAAKAGNTEVMVLLLAYGSDVNAQDHAKRTALHDAVRHHHTDAVRLLLQNNAQTNLRDSKRRTCLDLVTSKDTEIQALLKASPEQSEKSGKEKSKKRLSQSLETSDSPRHKERKTSRASDDEDSDKILVKAKRKDLERREVEDKKSSWSSLPSNHSAPMASTSATSVTAATATATVTATVTATATPSTSTSTSISTAAPAPPASVARPRSNSDVNGEAIMAPLKKQKLHSRSISTSSPMSVQTSSQHDDPDTKPFSGASKKRRETERSSDSYGGKVKIKKEREDDGPSAFRPLSGSSSSSLSSRMEELRRVASTPALSKERSHSQSIGARATLSSSRPASVHGQLPGSTVASISPPLTESSSSTSPSSPGSLLSSVPAASGTGSGGSKPTPSQVASGAQDGETIGMLKSRKRNSQSFTSASGYQKFVEELKLVNSIPAAPQRHYRQKSTGSLPTSTKSGSGTAELGTGPETDATASRKKAKTSTTTDVNAEPATSTAAASTTVVMNGKPGTSSSAMSATATLPTPAAATVSTAATTTTTTITAEDRHGGRKESESTLSGSTVLSSTLPTRLTKVGARERAPVRPVSSPASTTMTTSTMPAVSAATTTTATTTLLAVKKEEVIEKPPSMRSVQDAQRYLPLYTVQLCGDSVEGDHQQHQGARLWSPLSSMISDRCAAAVKLNFEVLPAECQFSSWSTATTAMSRLKEHEKQKFLMSEVYFIRLEEVIEVIKRDYSQLNESMMTIMLDIGYDDQADMDVDEDETVIVGGLGGAKGANGAKGVLDSITPLSKSSLAHLDSQAKQEGEGSPLKLAKVKEEEDPVKIKKEKVSSRGNSDMGHDGYNDKSPPTLSSSTSSAAISATTVRMGPAGPMAIAPPAMMGGSGVGGYVHKLRGVPAKLAAKAMFKDLQLQYHHRS